MHRILVTSLFILTFFHQIALAQEAEAVDEVGKASTGVGLVDKVLNLVDLFSYENEKVALSAYPAVAYSPRDGMRMGGLSIIKIKNNNNQEDWYRPTLLMPQLTWSTKNQVKAELGYDVYLKKWNLQGNINLALLPNDEFYGIGAANSSEQFTLYTSNSFSYNAEFNYMLRQELMVGFGMNYMHQTVADIDNPEILPISTPGYEGGNLIGFGPILRWDTRNNNFYPTSGHWLNLQASFYTPGLSDYQFNLFTAEIRKFFTIVDEKNILALQGRVDITDGEVPFFLMPGIGGSKRLRGIDHFNRYLDNNAWFAQVEFRRHLWWRFSGATWAGAGQTTTHAHQFSLQEAQFVGGAGLRFQATEKDRLNVRVDVGFGSGGQKGIYLSILEAF
ncbi:BamA/TamA family outer membrane protein [Persicobacter diffluens]|uniref:BamA/TamA family outer membrane protein n=1 Tax=Persicobacter diffluens TaxID=981 RepID=UPI0030C77855